MLVWVSFIVLQTNDRNCGSGVACTHNCCSWHCLSAELGDRDYSLGNTRTWFHWWLHSMGCHWAQMMTDLGKGKDDSLAKGDSLRHFDSCEQLGGSTWDLSVSWEQLMAALTSHCVWAGLRSSLMLGWCHTGKCGGVGHWKGWRLCWGRGSDCQSCPCAVLLYQCHVSPCYLLCNVVRTDPY